MPNGDLDGLRSSLGDLVAVRDEARGGVATSSGDERSHLLGQIASHQRAIEELLHDAAVNGPLRPDVDPFAVEADVPLTLLPVRVETRFSEDSRLLKIRVFPDELHLETHQDALSAIEIGAGTAYWQAAWAAGDSAEQLQAAWKQLLASVGPAQRARFVAASLTPRNAPGGGAKPDIPELTPRADDAKPPPPLARLLPDRWYAVAFVDGQAHPGGGSVIPDELVAGLDLSGEVSGFDRAGDPITSEGMRWLVDYDTAKENGMAFEVDLGAPTEHVDRLLVFGLRSSLGPQDCAARLEQLLRSHAATSGLAFVPQGSLTNNTGAARSGWQGSEPIDGPGEPGDPAAVANAAVLAAALGVPAAALAALPHGDDAEQAEAQAMATVLWEPSFGTYLQRAMRATDYQPILSPARIEDVRAAALAHVRARGPLPAIRVRNEPYGVLPVSSLDQWTPEAGETFGAGTVDLFRKLRDVWRESVRGVPRLVDPQPGQGLDDALLAVLGLLPVSVDVRVRTVVEENFCRIANQVVAGVDDSTGCEAQQELNQLALGLLGLAGTGVSESGVLQAASRRLGLPLVIPDPPGGESPDRAYLRSLGGEGAADQPQSLLSALAHYALGLELERESTLRPYADKALPFVPAHAVGQALRAQLQEPGSPVELAPLREEVSALRAVATAEPVDATSSIPAVLALDGRSGRIQESALSDKPVALTTVGAWASASKRVAEVQEALRLLGGVPAERLSLLLRETLDLASHRLDAWITSLSSARLDALRAATPAGTILGGYAWVEEIENTQPAPAPGGYVHAPSLAHAATAAVLRAGRMAHLAQDPATEALHVDLSSTRMRVANALLDGVRQGQPLSALLGYRLERQLHETKLDRLIAPLRELAPLVAGKIARPLEVADPAAESVAADNVVDAVALLQKADVLGDLATRLQRTGRPTVSVDEQGPLAAAIAATRDAYDAAADLLLAESVHQLVGGNLERAAATLDAAASGESPPPDPQVLQTPRNGITLAHRVAVVLSKHEAAVKGWPKTPRGRAEPRLEAWAQQLFGPPDGIVVGRHGAAATTLDRLGLGALDLLALADAPAGAGSTLERLVAEKLPAGAQPALDGTSAGEDSLSLGDAIELARALAGVVAGARLLDGVALGAAQAKSAYAPDAPELLDRAQKALDELDHATAELRANPSAATAADLAALVAFGFPLPTTATPAEALATLAAATAAEATSRITGAAAAIAAAQGAGAASEAAEHAARAVATVFGGGFRALPLQSPVAGATRVAAALAAPPDGAEPEAVRDWCERLGRVRPGVGRLKAVLLLADAFGRSVPPRVAQLAGGDAPAAARWIGLPFGAGGPPRDLTTSLVVFGDGDAAGDVCGLIVDEWFEVVPGRPRLKPAADDAPPPAPAALTGVALNANAPNARAPQAVLLAVSPDGQPWSTDKLQSVLLETLELARARAVTLETLLWAPRLLPALYTRDAELQGHQALALGKWSERAVQTEYLVHG